MRKMSGYCCWSWRSSKNYIWKFVLASRGKNVDVWSVTKMVKCFTCFECLCELEKQKFKQLYGEIYCLSCAKMVEKYAREARIEQEHSFQSRKIDTIVLLISLYIWNENIRSWPKRDRILCDRRPYTFNFRGPCSQIDRLHSVWGPYTFIQHWILNVWPEHLADWKADYFKILTCVGRYR